MKKYYIYTIHTSGYSDRYLSCKLEITDNEATFRDAESYATYVARNGDDYKTARDRAYNAPATKNMSGRVDKHKWAQLTLSDNDLDSINAYLVIKHNKAASYTPEVLAKFETQLKQHPLRGDLLEIVKYQIRKCDEQNIDAWGSVIGQEADQ